MKTILIVIGILVAYLSIGYAFVLITKALDYEHSIEDDEYFIVGFMWIITVPLILLFYIVRFIGKKLAILPIAILTYVKSKKEDLK